MKSNWKIVMISLLIGGFLGSALTLAVIKYHREGRGGGMRHKFYKELKLSPEQKAKVDAIMQASKEKMEAIRNATRQQVRPLLNPEQQTTFDAMNARHDERRKKRLAKARNKLH